MVASEHHIFCLRLFFFFVRIKNRKIRTERKTCHNSDKQITFRLLSTFAHRFSSIFIRFFSVVTFFNEYFVFFFPSFLLFDFIQFTPHAYNSLPILFFFQIYCVAKILDFIVCVHASIMSFRQCFNLSTVVTIRSANNLCFLCDLFSKPG